MERCSVARGSSVPVVSAVPPALVGYRDGRGRPLHRTVGSECVCVCVCARDR